MVWHKRNKDSLLLIVNQNNYIEKQRTMITKSIEKRTYDITEDKLLQKLKVLQYFSF